jgi:zinc protease
MKRTIATLASLSALVALVACAQVPAADPAPPSKTLSVAKAVSAAETAPPLAALSTAVAGLTASSAPSEFKLANGMTLIVKVDRRSPTAVHMVWVRAGAMDEVDGTSGIAHMLEHMMFKGTPTVPAGEFSRRVAALGGRENAFTNRDYTGYYQQIPADRLGDVMRLESDRFANIRFDDSEFQKERQVVTEERRMRTEENPRALLGERLNAIEFLASPYRRPVIGWPSDIAEYTADDVRAFHDRWYEPANAVVVVVGDVDPQHVLKLAEETYGRIPARAVPVRKSRAEPVQKGERRFDFKAPAEQAYVALSFKVPGLDSLDPAKAGPQDDQALALTVLAAVLDGYDGARLSRTLAQGAGRVADAVGADHSLIARGPKVFSLSGVPAAGHTAAEVEAALRGAVACIAREGVGEAELRRVKTQWRASEVYKRDSTFGQAQELGSDWVEGLPLNASSQILRRLEKVTAAQVQNAARIWFGDDQLTVGTLLPQPVDHQRRPAPSAPAGGDVH